MSKNGDKVITRKTGTVGGLYPPNLASLGTIQKNVSFSYTNVLSDVQMEDSENSNLPKHIEKVYTNRSLSLLYKKSLNNAPFQITTNEKSKIGFNKVQS